MTDEKLKLNTIKNNTVHILGGFNDSILENIIPKLYDFIENQKGKVSKDDLVFNIHSYGGQVTVLMELIALINEAKANGIKVITKSYAKAYSCGAMLLICGDERIVFKHTHILFHAISNIDYTTTELQVDRSYKDIKDMFKIFKDIIKQNTKMPQKLIDDCFKDDGLFIWGKDAVKLGIATKCI